MLLNEARMRELIRESLIMTEMRESLSSAIISEEMTGGTGVGKVRREPGSIVIHDPSELSPEQRAEYFGRTDEPGVVDQGLAIRAKRGKLFSRLSVGDAPFSIVRNAWNSNYGNAFEDPSKGWMYWSNSSGWSQGKSLIGFPMLHGGGRPIVGHSMSGLITLDGGYFACIGYGHFVTHTEFQEYKKYMVPEGFDPDTGGMMETECDAPDDCRVSPEDERRLTLSEMGRSKKDNILRSDLRNVGEAVKENLLAFQKSVKEGVITFDDYDPDHPAADSDGLVSHTIMGRQVERMNQDMFDALVLAFYLFYVPGQIGMTPDRSDPWLSETGGAYMLRSILEACADNEKIGTIRQNNYFYHVENEVLRGNGRDFNRQIGREAQRLWTRGWREQNVARVTRPDHPERRRRTEPPGGGQTDAAVEEVGVITDPDAAAHAREIADFEKRAQQPANLRI